MELRIASRRFCLSCGRCGYTSGAVSANGRPVYRQLGSTQSSRSNVPSVLLANNLCQRAVPVQTLLAHHLLCPTDAHWRRKPQGPQTAQGQRILRQPMPTELSLPQPHKTQPSKQTPLTEI